MKVLKAVLISAVCLGSVATFAKAPKCPKGEHMDKATKACVANKMKKAAPAAKDAPAPAPTEAPAK